MRKLIFMISLTLVFCVTAQTSRATKAYVTDSFSVRLHGGPGMENIVLKLLPSGLPVEVLESRAEWSLVQSLQDGDNAARGWIMTRYLITREPWESQVGHLMKDLSLLKQQLADTEKRIEQAAMREERLIKETEDQTLELNRLRGEYLILKRDAADYLKLKAACELARKDTETLARENDRLRSSQINRWFATGALVLLCGLFIGLLIGRQQKRRRSLYS